MVFVWTHLRIIKHVSSLVLLRHFFSHLSRWSNLVAVARWFSGNFHPAKSLSARRTARKLLELCFHWQRRLFQGKNWALWVWVGFGWMMFLCANCWGFEICVFSWFEILNMPATESRVKVDCFQNQLTLLLETCDMGQMCLMFLYSIPEMWQCRRSYYMIIHHLYL